MASIMTTSNIPSQSNAATTTTTTTPGGGTHKRWHYPEEEEDNNCPCCSPPPALPESAVFLTVWAKEDRERERGMGRWFDTLQEAANKFLQLRKEDKIYAALIDRRDQVFMRFCLDWVEEEEE